MGQNVKRMQELVSILNRASDAYYNTGKEIMSDRSYDALYDELQRLEEAEKIVLSGSPTANVGYEVSEKLEKETHEVPALSLNKTKELSGLEDFLGEHEGVLSWKLDGLTVVLTYEDGLLAKAVTRGNGLVGEVVTNNAKCFRNVPLSIPTRRKLIVRGEALITYEDFERVNDALPEGEEPYKNPRNLCSGSVRQLDPNETKRRGVTFRAFSMTMEDDPFQTRTQQFEALKSLGFTVVGYQAIPNAEALKDAVHTFESRITQNEFPSDGLVLSFNDITYGDSLGQTSKFPRHSIAFKWEDEMATTVLRKVEWNASRTGLINPVAVFDPVTLEGTTVSRASVHNVSCVEELNLVPGDMLTVYKANMIIPQVAENLNGNQYVGRKEKPEIPKICPVCKRPTLIRSIASDAKTLWCTNPDCAAKHVGAFVHATKRDALNMEGLSEETIKKLIERGVLRSLPDLYRLEEHKDDIVSMEGFGERSYEKLVNSMSVARIVTPNRLLYALGISNVGRTASKAICNAFGNDVVRAVNATYEELVQIPDIGGTIARSYTEWFSSPVNQETFEDLLSEVRLEVPSQTDGSKLKGKTFVITGSLTHFKNRDELKAKIESLGGKVSGSVSSNTTALINNDITSMSGKNKKAKALGIPIVTEDEFLQENNLV